LVRSTSQQNIFKRFGYRKDSLLCEEQQLGNKRRFKRWKEDYNLFEVASKSYFIDGAGVIERARRMQKTVLRKTGRGNGICITGQIVQGLRKGLF
jgi:hypothetical protein